MILSIIEIDAVLHEHIDVYILPIHRRRSRTFLFSSAADTIGGSQQIRHILPAQFAIGPLAGRGAHRKCGHQRQAALRVGWLELKALWWRWHHFGQYEMNADDTCLHANKPSVYSYLLHRYFGRLAGLSFSNATSCPPICRANALVVVPMSLWAHRSRILKVV